MRIVHVTNYYMPELGYQEGQLARWHAQWGHEVHVITSARMFPAQGDYATFESVYGDRIVSPGTSSSNGVTVHRLPVVVESNFQMLLRGLPRLVRELEPDVVIAHGFSRLETLRLAFVRRRASFVLIVDDHTFESAFVPRRLRRPYYFAVKKLWKRIGVIDVFVAVTSETRRFLASTFSIPFDKIHMIPLGADTTRFFPQPGQGRAVRAEWGVPTDCEVIVYAGKITREKGVHMLVQASVPVLRERADTHLVMIGSGDDSPFADELRSTAEAAGLADRVHILPHVPNEQLPAVFAASDVAVWPWQETMTALQAAACGLPIVLRDSEVGREWTSADNGETWTTLEELSEILGRLLSDKVIAQRMGDRGVAMVAERYDWEAISQAFLDVIRVDTDLIVA